MTLFISGGVNVGAALLRVEFTPTVMNEILQCSTQDTSRIDSCALMAGCSGPSGPRRPSPASCSKFFIPYRPLSGLLKLPRRFIDAAVKNFIPPLAGWPIPPLIGYYCKIGCATFLMRERACAANSL